MIELLLAVPSLSSYCSSSYYYSFISSSLLVCLVILRNPPIEEVGGEGRNGGGGRPLRKRCPGGEITRNAIGIHSSPLSLIHI
eukprot:793829-Pyramimonas_sp.AAC.1